MNLDTQERIRERQGLRDALSADIENFLANGGEITYHSPEESRFNQDLAEERVKYAELWASKVAMIGNSRSKHHRLKALEACGNENWRKCTRCGRYDDPENMLKHSRKKGSACIHRARGGQCVNMDLSPIVTTAKENEQ